MSFAQLQPPIMKALEQCGYTTPTPVQAKAIPLILKRHDLVACSPTGSGKTAAFVLPALEQLATTPPIKAPRVLILTPTRELATQISVAATKYGKYLRFNIVSLVGGMSYNTQIRGLQRGADIIVATPGRLLDHCEQRRVDLSAIDLLILDEADRMLDMGFIDDIMSIVDMTPAERQTLLFSATVDNQLDRVIKKILNKPVRIDLSGESKTIPQIEQVFYETRSPRQKLPLLKYILANEAIFKAIIFSATKIDADRIADELCDAGYKAGALHGDLRQGTRTRTLDKLRQGRIDFLVATDVAARGIDITDISHVINMDLPRGGACEDYVHRIGRTARAGRSGKAISFILPGERRQLGRIERLVNKHLKILPTPNLSEFEKSAAYSAGAGAKKHENKEEHFYKERHERRDFGDKARPTHKKREDVDTRWDDEKPQRFRKRRDESPELGRAAASTHKGEKRFAGEKPKRSFNKKWDDEKPRFSRDKGEKRFSSDAKPAHKKFEKKWDDEKPRFSRDKSESRFSSDEKPKRSFDKKRDDEKPRFSRDKSDKRFGGDEKPKRSFGKKRDDDNSRFSRDKSERSFSSSEKPKRSFAKKWDDEKPRFSRDKNEKSSRDDKPARRFEKRDDDKSARFGAEKSGKRFSSDKPSFKGGKKWDDNKATKKPSTKASTKASAGQTIAYKPSKGKSSRPQGSAGKKPQRFAFKK